MYPDPRYPEHPMTDAEIRKEAEKARKMYEEHAFRTPRKEGKP